MHVDRVMCNLRWNSLFLIVVLLSYFPNNLFGMNPQVVEMTDTVPHKEILKSVRRLDFSWPEEISNLEKVDKDLLEQLKLYSSIINENGIYWENSNVGLLTLQEETNNQLINSLQLLNSGIYRILYKYEQEDLAVKELTEALKIAIGLKEKELVCEISKAILIYHDKLFAVQDYPDYYLNVYDRNVYDKIEKQIYSIYKLDLDLFFDNDIVDRAELKNLEDMVESIQNPYHKAFAYKTLGIFYDKIKANYKRAREYHELGLEIIRGKKSGRYLALEKALLINLAVVKFGEKKYREVIIDLNKLDLTITGKSGDYYRSFRHAWLSNSYKSLGMYDSAYFHLEESRKIRNQLNQITHAANVAKIRVVEQTAEKEAAINRLDQEKSKLQKDFYTVLPILGIVTAILAITFLLYRRYKNRSTKLETEKSETLQKLDELKNIVIKNHIILKDKTKVYISDLMYIKSEDHYLKIFTSDGKNHFVRGKLSGIREELPPNFIQCHRSYIVNSNFIKRANNHTIFLIDKTQIPLSRSFKSRFRK